jgi:uncharacterized protein (DUF2384 family)
MASSRQLETLSAQTKLGQPIPRGPAEDMLRYRHLVARTVEVFGDELKASRWLSLPNPDLSGETPLEAAQKNGYDAQTLEPILIRIEHGIDY